jgi:hypothetical protein
MPAPHAGADDSAASQQFRPAHVFVRLGKKIHHSWTSELWSAKPDPGEDMLHVDFM